VRDPHLCFAEQMQPELPNGHKFNGASWPALGGNLFRLTRQSDGRDVLARSAGGEYPSEADIRHLDAELATPILDDDALLRPVQRVDGLRQSWLLYEGVSGEPLDTTKVYSIGEFWDFACALTRELAKNHRAGRVHGRLESNCIWWDSAQAAVGVVGWLSSEQGHLANQLPASVDTAPELLVRAHAKVSPSADIYSLGALLYRLLSGRPAVESSGDLAFDIAAYPPVQLDPLSAPEPLANLLSRMLSKSAAARPTSMLSVLEELEAIRNDPRATRPNLAFRFDTMIGRTGELERLTTIAHQAHASGATVVRIEGEPGVGKSHLLSEFVSRVSVEPCLVARAKFEQFVRGRPHSALLTACANALSQAFSGDELIFATTKQRLHDADPLLLGVLAADIPELQHIHGRLTPVLDIGPSESKTRFKRAFHELLARLSNAEAPLIVVLDDLHWADQASADLLTELIAGGLPEHLLLVLVYREPNASSNGALRELWKAIGKSERIVLPPLGFSETRQLCRTAVPACNNLESLASTVFEHSQGNALHSVELLKSFVAAGQLTFSEEYWHFTASSNLHSLSETVVELIRERVQREHTTMRGLLAAAACLGHDISDELLAIATAAEEAVFRDQLDESVRRGFLVASERPGCFRFCHDRIQQVALELSPAAFRDEVQLRLGRHYRARIGSERAALFVCLDYLNPVGHLLSEDERSQLTMLNLDGARRARSTIAYDRAIPLAKLYLQNESISNDQRFDALLLLAECLSLSAAVEDRRSAQGVFTSSASLAHTREQKLKLLHSRLLCYVHDQDYSGGVEVGLSALRVLGHALPDNPSLARAVASVVKLSARMWRADPNALAQLPDRATDHDLEVFRFLVALWGPSHWANPNLNALVCVRLVEMTLRCGNGQHSSMAYASYAAICHMQGRYEQAMRYGRVADALARTHSPYTRAIAHFLTLTFFGVFQQRPAEVVARYDVTLSDVVAHGEIVASHIIDGAVTMLPHLGPEVGQVVSTLKRYEREARTIGATTSLEIIHLVRCWCDQLVEGSKVDALHSPVVHDSFLGSRDMLRMQIEYLQGNDAEVLRIGRCVRENLLIKGNPLHKASYALFVVLAATRFERTLTAPAKEAIKFLKTLDAVRVERSPQTFRSSLVLARGVAALSVNPQSARELLFEAVALASEHGHGLLHAIALERLADAHAKLGEYPLYIERLREAAHRYRRFGAVAKAEAMARLFVGIDWSQTRSRNLADARMQTEGIMRAASLIVEASSTNELGPTLLRVIATAAGAMRAFLFTRVDGKLSLVARCERDLANVSDAPIALEHLDPKMMALKLIRRVERFQTIIELPRDRDKFLDDPYLMGIASPQALLCVPLLYRGDLTAILYLENSSNDETFSQDDITLVSLLGKQAAIAITNANTHRFEIEAIQSKVNPHFLYNALSVIAELVGRSPDEAEEAVYKLTRLYRYMLSSSADQRVPLERELSLVRDYLDLEKARFGERLRVRWEIEAATSGFPVPMLLIQPLAENAVNHGVRRNVNGGTVVIAARVEGDDLCVSVRDDGPGWYEGSTGTGFGLKSVRRRLQLVYGNNAELRIDKSHGVSVHMRIPLGC